MNMRAIDEYFLEHPEPVRSCLLSLRHHILGFAPGVTETWNYKMPFYRYQGKRFCYLWYHKKLRQPYIGIVDGHKVQAAGLISEGRTKMKIFLVDPEKTIH